MFYFTRRTVNELWTNAKRTLNERFVNGERTLNKRWTNAKRNVTAIWKVNGKLFIHSECFRSSPYKFIPNEVMGQSHSRSRTNHSCTKHAQIGFVRACASKNWQVFWDIGCRNHWQIMHKPHTYHLPSPTYHWHIAHVDAYEQIRRSIPRTSDARPTHGSLTEPVKARRLRERSTYKQVL
jgi:hypothetical protein